MILSKSKPVAAIRNLLSDRIKSCVLFKCLELIQRVREGVWLFTCDFSARVNSNPKTTKNAPQRKNECYDFVEWVISFYFPNLCSVLA